MPRRPKLRARPLEPRLRVVLVEPEIPPNTGSVARTCAATQSALHLVGKLGFRIDEQAVRRAGLDVEVVGAVGIGRRGAGKHDRRVDAAVATTAVGHDAEGRDGPVGMARRADPTLAAPGLAHMIHAAGRGDAQALTLVAQMADQMSRVGGDMSRVAAVIRPLINGERNADRLCARMDTRGQQLVLQILDELGRLDLH